MNGRGFPALEFGKLGKMNSDQIWEHQTHEGAARPRREEYDSPLRRGRRDLFFDEDGVRSGYSCPEPRTLVRFPDCGQSEWKAPACEKSVPAPEVKRRFSVFRLALRFSAVALIWSLGLAAGLFIPRDYLLRKAEKTAELQNDGAYVVEEGDSAEFSSDEPKLASIGKDPVVRDSVAKEPVIKEPAGSIAAAGKKSETSQDIWPIEVLDSVASIPPWNPDGRFSPDAEDRSIKPEPPIGPFKAAESFVPEEVNLGAAPHSDPMMMPFEPMSGEIFTETAAVEPDMMIDPMPPFEPASEPVSEPVETVSAKPMKNQIEYFEPFDTMTDETAAVESEPNKAVRVTASEDFYTDAFGVDNFSDYIPPQRDEAAKTMTEQIR